MSKIRLF